MTRIKKRPFFLALGTVLLFMAGGAIAYWVVHRRTGGGPGVPAGARAIPDSALITLSLSTDPEQWQRLREFGTPETQANFDQQLARWSDRWLHQYDLSFATHLQPWVGSEVSLAWLPPAVEGETNSGGEAEAEAGVNENAEENNSAPIPRDPFSDDPFSGDQARLMVLPIADAEAAQDLAATLPLTADPEATVEYRGVTLNRYAPPEDSTAPLLWMGVLGTELVIIADGITTAEAAVDAYRGGDSIVDLPGYRPAFEAAAQARPFGKLYVNVPAAIQSLAESSQPPLSPAVLNTFQSSQGLVATVTLATQGLQIQSSSWLPANSDRTYPTQVPIAAQVAQYLPQDTLLMASGSNFQQFWQDLSQGQTWGALTALNPDALALALQAGTGLTMEEDLLPWMGGEFALALLPSVPPMVPEANASTDPGADPGANPEVAPETEPGVTPNPRGATVPNPNLVLLAQVSDRPLAEKTFAQLNEVVESRYRFQVQRRQVEDVALTDWVSPFQSVTLTHGWLNNTVVFLAIGEGTASAIAPPPTRPLNTQSLFQLATAAAPQPNNGHFYLNLKALAQRDGNLFLPALPPETQGMLQALEGLGVTTTILDDRRLRYDLFVALKRGDRPGPLPPITPPEGEASPAE
ncbi:DUF3352 domain-containing protein [Leptolyngbya sp. PCC 6406]|uniref:DUF3352 domain-containing protein n=1 Tax=Leptolyngbya sp. PCC 6406 TaxID=1173264 RepID=UPI0002ABA7A8|nr:DUF3352 domain-containing protein [Leptolyngbya sp. PCC 6406]